MVFNQMPEKFLSRILAILAFRRPVHSHPESARPKSSSSLVVLYYVKGPSGLVFWTAGRIAKFTQQTNWDGGRYLWALTNFLARYLL